MAASRRRVLLITGFSAVFAAGLGVGAWSYRQEEQAAFAELTANALRCAVAFHGGELQVFTGTRTDLNLPAYLPVKERLVALRHVQEDVRFVYLFRPVPGTGEVVFLADSEPAGSPDVSLPGDVFAEARSSPGLQRILATGLPAHEGPLRDSFGVWVTAYAPVRTADRFDVIGLDVEASRWRMNLVEHGFRAALYVWLLLGLPLATLAIVRRAGAQERRIRELSEAFEQSRSALLILDPDGRVEYANQGACEQLGYAREELIGRRWTAFRAEESDAASAGVPAARDAGGVWQATWVNRRKSDELYPVHVMVSPVEDAKGRVFRQVAALRDMTEAKRIETELRLAKERAESGERAKGEFLDTMSHELRTPLNGIVGFTSLLLETPLTAEQRGYVETVRSSGEVLLKLTGDILDYSQMDLRPPPLDPEPCSVRVLLEQVLDLLAYQAAEKGLVLLHQAGQEVPASVLVDAGRLRQILVNLVGNAVKFTESGEVEVRVRARPAEGASDDELWLDIAVRDTGPGIAEKDQAKLFEPFTQVDSSINRRHGGAGLGLAISRSLARLLGGDLTLRSKPGEGAVFRLSVPVKRLQARADAPLLAGHRVGLVVRTPALLREVYHVVASAGGNPVACRLENLSSEERLDVVVVDCDQSVMAQVIEGAIDTSRWSARLSVGLVTSAHGAEDRRLLRGVFQTLLNKPLHHDEFVGALAAGLVPGDAVARPQFGMRVLLVDDNAVNLRLLQGVVAALGCRSVAVSSGREALELLQAGERFDLMMLDLRMPDMDGSAVLRRVRAGEAGDAARSLWITIVTAEARTGAREALFAQGCNDFIAKPVTLASCMAALQRAKAGDGRHAR